MGSPWGWPRRACNEGSERLGLRPWQVNKIKNPFLNLFLPVSVLENTHCLAKLRLTEHLPRVCELDKLPVRPFGCGHAVPCSDVTLTLTLDYTPWGLGSQSLCLRVFVCLF